jgi:hypothetical protein
LGVDWEGGGVSRTYWGRSGEGKGGALVLARLSLGWGGGGGLYSRMGT